MALYTTHANSSEMGVEGVSLSSPAIMKVTDVQEEERIPFYDLSVKGSGAYPLSEKHDVSPRRKTSSKAETPEDRYLFNKLLGYARNCAANMKQHAHDGQPMDLSIAVTDLRGLLEDLWGMRAQRSEDWAMVLNSLQISLAGTTPETMTEDQCVCIERVVTKHLTEAATSEDIESAIDLLENAGLDSSAPLKGFREEE